MERAEAGYGAVAKILHWLIFVLLAAQYAVGSIMPHIGRNTPNESWVAWHLSLGAAITFFIFVRLVWKLARPVPVPASTPAWHRSLAVATHWSLYVLVIAMVMLGWPAANYRGWTVMLFGVIPLPALAEKGARWAHTAGDVHDTLVYVLLVPIALHVAAVVHHQYGRRDGTLARMLWGK